MGSRVGTLGNSGPASADGPIKACALSQIIDSQLDMTQIDDLKKEKQNKTNGKKRREEKI